MKMSTDLSLQILPYTISSAAANMAIDEGMLDELEPGSIAMRCYGWSEPAWTFGYSQRWQEIVAAKPAGVTTLIRRPTGGGIVDHRTDFTYSLAIPTAHPWWRNPACEVYQSLHLALANALQACGYATRQQPCQRDKPRPAASPTEPKACFSAPETSDLVHPQTGQKWAGAALKRSRTGLLIQGSLQPDPMPSGDWQSPLRQQLPNALATALNIQTIQTNPHPPLPNPKLQQKYQNPTWNQKR